MSARRPFERVGNRFYGYDEEGSEVDEPGDATEEVARSLTSSRAEMEAQQRRAMWREEMQRRQAGRWIPRNQK